MVLRLLEAAGRVQTTRLESSPGSVGLVLHIVTAASMFSAISSRSMIGGVPVKHVEMKNGWGNILWARVDRVNRI